MYRCNSKAPTLRVTQDLYQHGYICLLLAKRTYICTRCSYRSPTIENVNIVYNKLHAQKCCWSKCLNLWPVPLLLLLLPSLRLLVVVALENKITIRTEQRKLKLYIHTSMCGPTRTMSGRHNLMRRRQRKKQNPAFARCPLLPPLTYPSTQRDVTKNPTIGECLPCASRAKLRCNHSAGNESSWGNLLDMPEMVWHLVAEQAALLKRS